MSSYVHLLCENKNVSKPLRLRAILGNAGDDYILY